MARLKSQYKFKHHMLFSASFYKVIEEDQRSDETELFINLIISLNSTQTDIGNIDVKSQLKHQIQVQETKESGWISNKNNLIKINFFQTGVLNGSSYVKILL